MVAAAKASVASGCPLTALKGALCTRPYVKYVALAAAGGVLAYLIYAYAAPPPPAVEEPKADSAQKSPKKGGKSKRKKRRFTSSTKHSGGSSGSEAFTSSGKGRPLHPADSRRKSSTPRK
ncbi:hypothetical protein PRIPAC_92776 [Pristionchus pacificus]|uniref:Uncharacterized protein n=1 Tax=Pristionchus pacificus TaxID=54126 RepID=A0A2A6CE62_PRIPA|nr:hypothetical protein PRIPAC_92776 [Pristionchus pacificus]|eukprot:PDM76291.1 hypothetical protein PRIPAC_39895 [Pristionchus pacificus]